MQRCMNPPEGGWWLEHVLNIRKLRKENTGGNAMGSAYYPTSSSDVTVAWQVTRRLPLSFYVRARPTRERIHFHEGDFKCSSFRLSYSFFSSFFSFFRFFKEWNYNYLYTLYKHLRQQHFLLQQIASQNYDINLYTHVFQIPIYKVLVS